MRSRLLHSALKVDADGVTEDFWLRSEKGTITETGTGPKRPSADTVENLNGDMVTPGFIDLHLHGGGGYSVEEGKVAVGNILRAHRRHGTTRAVLSLVSQSIEKLERSLHEISVLAADETGVLGSHLEGPFLAPSKRGAHAENALTEPTSEIVDRLLVAADNTLLQVTLAPELKGAEEALSMFHAAGVAVAVGHTEANYDTSRDAFRAGASLLTHTFNAMPNLHHRNPGPIPAALENSDVTLELILDEVHVHPSVARLLLTTAPGRVALVTDAMAASSCSDGDYTLGSLEVEVRERVARIAGTDTIAGSTLTLDAALRNALRLGLSAPEAVAALTAVPAKALGLEHYLGLLSPGYAADTVQLNNKQEVVKVWGPAGPSTWQ